MTAVISTEFIVQTLLLKIEGKNDHADHEAASQALPQAADEVLAHLLCAGVEAPKPRSDTFARHRATFETAHGVLLSMRHASNLGI